MDSAMHRTASWQAKPMNASNKVLLTRTLESAGKVSKAKLKLLEAGILLMARKGFGATTLDDICTEAKIKKGSFYYYFEDKIAFTKFAISHFLKTEMSRFEDANFTSWSDPLQRVSARLDAAAEFFSDESRSLSGCLIGSVAQEASSTHPELRTICNEWFLRIVQSFEADFCEAQKAYTPTADFNFQQLGLFYVSLLQGSLLIGKSLGTCATVGDNIRLFRHLISTHFISLNGVTQNELYLKPTSDPGRRKETVDENNLSM
jgi:TetR/AcrR family transcriptional regulator, transcriptional repressor for nem operon